MKIWFISDTHFGSERVVRKYRRPFKNALEHDRYIVQAWNALVGRNDIVYHLGDVGDLHTLAQLNGNVRVLPGNHDDPRELRALDITVVEPWTVVKVKGVPVALTHDPAAPGQPKKVPLFAFGHLHRLFYIKDGFRLGVNVGVESQFFRPIDARELLYWFELLAGTPEHVILTRIR